MKRMACNKSKWKAANQTKDWRISSRRSRRRRRKKKKRKFVRRSHESHVSVPITMTNLHHIV
jgi:hypothetical protein